MIPRPPRSTLFPYTTLFRSLPLEVAEDHVLDAGLLERLEQRLGTLVDARVEPLGAGVEVQQTHLLVERLGVGEHPAERRLRVGLPRAPAERAYGGAGVQVGQPDPQGLPGAHRQP